jgi:murein DD-endopeptidase MepM/ murein hydrolase activator NlpD
MRFIAKIGLVTGLLLILQAFGALQGLAQVDPCTPIEIPGLCDPDPPTLPPPPDGGGGGGGGSGGGGGGGGSGGGGGGGSGSGGGGSGGGGGGGPEGSGGGGGGATATTPPGPAGPFTVSSPNNSQDVVDICSQAPGYGMTLRDCMLASVGPFPIAGLAYWNDDWHACRDGCTRFHEGLDMFARSGTPLVAIADGFVSQKLVGDLSGISVEITDSGGVQYFYAHLSAWAPGIEAGDRVHAGQVLGYVGNTGNAIYTPPHLHLEVQPGGIPVPPKPYVDRWVELAERQAAEVVAEIAGRPVEEIRSGATAASSFRLIRSFDLAGGAVPTDLQVQRLLALTGIQPSVSSIEMARNMLGQMSWEIDWSGQADEQLAILAEQYRRVSGDMDLSRATPLAPFGAVQVPVAEGLTGNPDAGD